MSIWPVPDAMLDEVAQVKPRMFTNRGIRLVILDVDNTLAPYTEDTLQPKVLAWAAAMRGAGLELFVLSNSRGERPERFAAELNLPWRNRAWKPFPRAAREVMAQYGAAPAQTAFIGDQVYTDVLCAKACGAFAVLLRPICFSRFVLRLRYWLEAPFRLKYRWKFMK